MKEPRHLAVLTLSPHELAQALKLPPMHTVVDASLSFDTGAILIKIEGPTLPEHEPGRALARMRVVERQVPQPAGLPPLSTSLLEPA